MVKRKLLVKSKVGEAEPVVKRGRGHIKGEVMFRKDEKIIKEEFPKDIQVAVRDYARVLKGETRSSVLKVIDATAFDLTGYLKVTDEQKTAFLVNLVDKGNLKDAAEATGVDPVDAYNLKRTDVEFAIKYQIAMELYYDSLEGIVRQKVVSGDDKWSAILLMFALKGGRPKYKEEGRYVSTGGGDINVYNSPLAGLSEEELLKIVGKSSAPSLKAVEGKGKIE